MRFSTLRLFATGILILLFSANSSNTFGQLTFNMEGTTAIAGSGYDLTPAVGGSCFNQYGALWCTTTLDFSRPFRLDFQAKFNPPAVGTGADGVCVVFGQMGDTAAPAGVGGGLGYYATPSPFTSHSFAIELDIFNNGPSADDIAQDHTTITKNANITVPISLDAAPVAINPPGGIKDNTFRNYTVVWSPATQTLIFYCNCHRLIVSHYNYAAVFSTPTTVNWGFTASTGGDCAQQFVQGITTSIPTVPTFDTSLCASSLTLTDTASGPLYYWLPDSATTSSITATTTGTYSVLSYDTASCLTSSEIFHVTLNPVPAISGRSTVCTGDTIRLTTSVSGGTWTSSNPAVGSVGSASGIVTGVSPGTVTITYTTAAGCTATYDVTVNLSPTISGTYFMCAGTTVTLTGTPAGGTWSTSSSAISVGSATGVVTGLSASTPLVTYTLPDGCPATQRVTVNPVPFLLSPVLTICVGGRDTLSASLPGIAWSTSNPAVASIAALGTSQAIVTGASPGTAVISYTVTATGCSSSSTVTVNPDPVISGTLAVCAGSTTSLSATPPGGTWSSDATSIATVGSTGIVTGGAAGTAHIGYVVPGAGCFTFKTVTVNTTPIPYTITVPICVGETFTAASLPTGGTWTSSNTAIATVGSSTALVTGTGVGVAHITYTLPVTGCFMTFPLTVNAAPAPLPPIPPVCVGSSETLTDAVSGGVWSSSVTATATIGSASGFATGVATGVTTITYATALGATCYVTGLLTVNTAPVITGPDSVCVASNITLSGSPSGGTWSPASGTHAIISASGVVTGTSSGVATITYTLPSGCTSTYTITVNALPPAIEGLSAVCVGDAVTLHDPVSGTWSSGSAHVSVGSTTGGVTGLSAGGAIITFTSSAGGCVTTEPFTVNPLPAPISPPDTVCPGSTITLTDATGPGIFSGGTPGIATVSSSGVVTGISAGSITVTYTLTATGCHRDTTITVPGFPAVPAITGFDTVCMRDTTIFSDTYPGGTWVSSNSSIATVVPTASGGIACDVIGVTAGTDTIEYTVTNICGESTTVYRVVTVIASPKPSPIMGAPGVCSGSTDTLSDSLAGGTWTSSTPGIASIGSLSGIVTGFSTGMTEITYSVTNLCGTVSVYKTIAVNMPPYITTNTVLACHSLGDAGFGTGYSLPDSGCALVCDSSIVRYYANGVAGSVFTWVVAGGTVVADYGDSIDVIWPTIGLTGSIILYDTVSHCTGFATACIQVIAKPHADFSKSASTVCLDESVVFTDLSTADTLSPIVSWHWDFGDGSGSPVSDPAHTYTAAGTYTVTLIVKNECGCTDTFRSPITVYGAPGPVIQCAAIVCDSELATYSTPVACGIYNWSVIGGTIVSGLGTNSIVVKWDHVGSGGFGYVSLAEPCAACPDTITIKVPVILQNAAITGPDVICAGHYYEYSLPLWAATQYRWGVLGDLSAISGPNNDYRVSIQISTPGTYTIHGWYQNRLKLCGANLDKTITVVPETVITGSTTVCQYSTDTFALADAMSATWTLTTLTGTVIASGTGTTFSTTFSVPGMYLLSASGPFCANPLTITVPAAPAIPEMAINGPTTVCLGRVYSYTDFYTTLPPGTAFSWTAIGGTVTPATGSATVNVVWTGSGTKQLNVSLVSTTAPYCASMPQTLTVTQEIINPNVTGDTVPCANAYRNYASNYTRGEVYDWFVVPAAAGSITGGMHASSVTVQWNNVSAITPAAVVVRVHKCDSIVSDTLNVNVQPPVPLVVSASPSPACPLDTVTLTVTSGDSVYFWTFGDGTPMAVTTTPSVRHPFPVNRTTANINYLVSVTGVPGVSFGCPPGGTATYSMPILPGPVANASAGAYILCPGGVVNVVGTVTSNVTGLTYQWYDRGGAITGATSAIYPATVADAYYFIVTGSDGCSGISDSVIFEALCGGDTSAPCSLPYGYSTSDTCRNVYLFGGPGPSPQWSAFVTPSSGPIPAGRNAVVSYMEPGVYLFRFSYYDTCDHFTDLPDTVGIVPAFRYQLKCAAGGMDSITLTDYSAYLPFWNPTLVTWSDAGGTVGTGSSITIARSAPGTYFFTETISGTRPGGRTFSCDTLMSITLPGPPVASFTDSVTPICENVPVQFTSLSSSGVIGYSWDFGDGALSLLPNPKRNFTYRTPGTPHVFSVTLTVKDSIGCTDDTTVTVGIFQNDVLGRVFPSDPVICSNAAPETLAYLPTTGTIISYLWSTGDATSSISVGQSGSYWVTVTDSRQCVKTFPTTADQVEIIPNPTNAFITGQDNYCIPQAVHLSGYEGTGLSYIWLRDGATVFTTPTITDPGLPPADYNYQLILVTTDHGVSCYDTSAAFTVHMYGLPAPPMLSGPVALDCSEYLLSITASEPVDGLYNWSDGTHGATDYILTGGPYRVWFTDLFGCTSYKDTVVPYAPATYFPYFPSGCYTLCTQQLPLTLFGPPGASFSYWAWLMNSSVASSGSGFMGSYTIDTDGTYQWTLGNGLCTQTSDPMNVSLEDCNKCNDTTMSVAITCDTANPASYGISVMFTSPAAGTSYVIGTDIGPIDPFSGTLAGSGSTSLTLTFTTLYPTSLPDSVTVQIALTLPDGSRCFLKKRVPLPSCHWIDERPGHPADSTQGGHEPVLITNSMLVYPNPTTGNVTISYDYGSVAYQRRSISIFNALGSLVTSTIINDVHGNWNVNAANWSPGIYIIRMEAGGKALQTQRMVMIAK